jgi:hypothetical protein
MSYFVYYHANNREGMGYCKFGVGKVDERLAFYMEHNPQIGRRNLIDLKQNPKDLQSSKNKPYGLILKEEMVNNKLI